MPREPLKPALLSGRVTRASDGAAVAGAVVALAGERRVLGNGSPPIVVTSGSDGRWTANVSPDSYVLSIAAAGFVPHTRELTGLAPHEQRTDVDVALDAGGAMVTGLITAKDHSPVANAHVRAKRDAGAAAFFAISGPDGRYQLSLAPGHYQLEVTHDDYLDTWENISADDQPTVANFVLTRGGVVRGQVIARDTGQPVPNAILQATAGRSFSNAEAGEDGKFELRGLADGTVTISARAQGYASVTPTLVDLDVGQQKDDVRVSVDGAFSIVGRVVSTNDSARGIPGVAVNAMRFDHAVWPAVGVSDADGNFELVGMLPGQHMLSAEKRGMLFEGGIEVNLVDSDITDVTIAMRSGLTISGRVEPPVVAQIALARPGGNSLGDYDKDAVSIAKARTETDATGAFTLREIPAGDFEVSAMAKDGSSGMLPVSLSNADQSALVIRLSPRTTVAGRVVDTNGKPVPGVYVFENRVDLPIAARFRRNGIFRGATTAPDGSFKIVGLDRGVWALSVTEPKGGSSNSAKVEVDLSDGSDRTGITISIEARDAQIRGTVLGPDRKPAVGAQVHAMRELPGASRQKFDVQSEPVRTDATGNFVIEKLRPGTYTVVAEGRGSKADTAGVRTGEATTILLSPLSSLAIAVTHEGKPAAKVELSCWGPVGSLGLQADADGAHTFTEVAQGEYRCEARSDAGTAKATITVRDEPAKLTLALDDYASLTGTAVDVLTGRPVAKLTVMAKGTGAETDASGRFLLERVPAGSDELLIMPKDQIGVGHDKHPYAAKPGQRVEVGQLKVVAPRVGDVGTFGLGVEVRDTALFVTKVKPGGPAERAGIKVGASVATIEGQSVTAIGLQRAERLLASEIVGVGQTLTLVLGSGERATMTAVRW